MDVTLGAALIVAIITLLGFWINHLLDTKKYQLQRQDVVADRKYIENIEARKQKIAEAKELINTYYEVTRELIAIKIGFDAESILIQNNLEPAKPRKTDKSFDRIEMLMNVPVERLMSISSLRDAKLDEMHRMIRKIIEVERERVHKMNLALLRKEPINVYKNTVEEAVLAKDSGQVIKSMSIRIDEIASMER